MKKFIFSLFFVASLITTSCDMQKDPVGTLDGDEPFSGISEASRYRDYIYAGLRSVTTSGYFSNPEIQMDMFQATNQTGNRGIVFASGDVLPTTGETASYFNAIILQVGSINYYLQKMKPLLESTDDDVILAEYNRYIGEAKFARAYYNILLFDRFCPEYTEANADAPALGIPVFETYNPSADRTTYYGRSTQNESLAFINKDLNEALTAMLDYEKSYNKHVVAMAEYVNSNVVKALQARLALWVRDYETAISKANEVIGTGKYKLATYATYSRMWTEDYATEIIFRPFMKAPNELSNSIGTTWLSIYPDRADYVPTQDCLDMYSRRTDARYNAFFGERELNFEGDKVIGLCFNKYPGNDDLKVSNANNIMNMPKPFRSSELYLILAEAYYESGNEPEALKALNEIRTVRIRNYKEEAYTGEDLRDEIRLERTKELIGEGFRMGDLRRWHLPMNRREPQDALYDYLWKSTIKMTYPANSYKFTWPIPLSELEVNPQMAGQQNPGY